MAAARTNANSGRGDCRDSVIGMGHFGAERELDSVTFLGMGPGDYLRWILSSLSSSYDCVSISIVFDIARPGRNAGKRQGGDFGPPLADGPHQEWTAECSSQIRRNV
jgi:hypothetical protein